MPPFFPRSSRDPAPAQSTNISSTPACSSKTQTEQGGLFVEKAVLSQSFFDELKNTSVPVEEAAVRQIANNSMALDVYCWLAYRLLPQPERAYYGVVEGPALASLGELSPRLDHFQGTIFAVC